MMTGGEVVDHPYKLLAYAIIWKAADDWNRITDGRRSVGLPVGIKPREAEKKEIEKFFRSKWFDLLAGDLDGEVLLDRLKLEAVKRKRQREQRGMMQ